MSTLSRIRVVVAEDEPIARDKLCSWIRAEVDLALVAETKDGPATRDALQAQKPDLLFLDVHMPGLSGLEVLEQAPRPPYIVFTTAHDQYAVAAFEIEAIDYLLKPFGPARFQKALDRVRTRLQNLQPTTSETLLRLYTLERGIVKVIPLNEIRRFEASGDYVKALTDAGSHLLSIRLATLEKRLDGGEFVRIHRSHIIRLSYIKEWERIGEGRLKLTMQSGDVINTSRAGGRLIRSHFGL